MTIPVHLRSAGTALPGSPVTNAMLAERFGMTPVWEQWVDTFVGTSTRHLSVDLATGEARYSLADLGETAASRALDAAGMTAGDVDLVVMGTSSPDQLMPATVNVIADRLGINDVRTYQLQSGCTGAIQAIDVAWQMLLSGRHTTALVLGGDVTAKHYDPTLNLNSLPPAQQINGLLFGDGVGAVVLTTEPSRGAALIRHVHLKLTGLGRAPGQVVDWFGAAGDDTVRGIAVREEYKAIEESVPVMACDTLDQMLAHLDWKKIDLDYLLPPQLSGRMTARISEHLDVPDAQEISCVQVTGNTGNALPFLQLERLLPLVERGDRAVVIAIESSKWIEAGLALEVN